MDDLIDRLADVRARPSRELDLTDVRNRVRQRRRRRHAAVGAMGVVVLLVGALGAGRLLGDGGDAQVEVVGPVDSAVTTTVPFGTEREVASGPMPDGGTWAFVVYESADRTDCGGGQACLCGRIQTTTGIAGDCFSVAPYDETINVLYSDGRENGGLLFARAVVAPEVTTVRISLAGPSVGEPAHNVGEVLEYEPVDVGLPLNFVFRPLPDDAVVTAVEALDANGEVLDTADGYAGIPD